MFLREKTKSLERSCNVIEVPVSKSLGDDLECCWLVTQSGGSKHDFLSQSQLGSIIAPSENPTKNRESRGIDIMFTTKFLFPRASGFYSRLYVLT